MVVFDFSQTPIYYKTVSAVYYGPAPRSYHCMQVMEGKLYIFAGDSKGTKLNDLWSFDPDTDLWTNISPNGDIPPARSHHACGGMGNVMFIYGGEDADGAYLSDLYQLDVYSMT